MTPEERMRMNSLCIRIQDEKNYKVFEALLRELNELIGHKELRFPQCDGNRTWQRTRPWKTVSGLAQKVVKNIYPNQPDKVEIAIAEAEDLFREIRIDNTFTDVDGQAVALKQGEHVDVTLEAHLKATVRKMTDGHA